jgi:hypothetical protein
MELNEALRRATPFAILGIVTFAVLGVIDGSFGDWQRHLYGAKSLLDCYCRIRADLDELSAVVIGLGEVIARLTWFDTMGAVVRWDTALIFDDWHRQLLLDGGGFLDVVGCSPDTFIRNVHQHSQRRNLSKHPDRMLPGNGSVTKAFAAGLMRLESSNGFEPVCCCNCPSGKRARRSDSLNTAFSTSLRRGIYMSSNLNSTAVLFLYHAYSCSSLSGGYGGNYLTALRNYSCVLETLCRGRSTPVSGCYGEM